MKLLITFVLTLLFCLSAHAQVPTAEELDQMYRDAHRRVESCAVIYRQKPYVREMGAIVPDPRDKWFAELRGCTKRARESVDLLTLGVLGVLNDEEKQLPSKNFFIRSTLYMNKTNKLFSRLTGLLQQFQPLKSGCVLVLRVGWLLILATPTTKLV
ncbi:hypothetical protein LCGC14_3092640 [marine sediment metagenome]|uniref:Uncharacterized protein n=1 Tax=marine sediment metagenome TaxID=412755 RepID=A0A0F8WYV3_9ZZZZ